MKPRWVYVSAYALLLVLWAWLVIGGRYLSLSMDEPLHIAAGYDFLTRWQLGVRYFSLSVAPPLLNAGEAILLFFTQPRLPLETVARWGKDFVAYPNVFLPYLMPMERTEVLARTPMMLLVVLLGALIFRWGKEIGGSKVGLLALALLTFDPSLLAHGRLANTDAGVAVVGTAALYAGWRWLERPAWKWAFVTGALLGLTLLAKFSGVLWVAAFGMLALGVTYKRWRSEGTKRVLQVIAIGTLASLLIWAAYGFSFGPTSPASWPLPAPTYWMAFQSQQSTAAQRIFIAFERNWFGTQWWYFPLNFIIKNPLPLLVAFLAGGWVFIWQSRFRPRLITLAVFPLLYASASIALGMNASYRHVLPIHPFLYLMAAKGLWDWLASQRHSRWPYLATGLLGMWYILGAILIFPDELSYFNELVGGPQNGYRYLVDFTRDWGQSYKELRTWLKAHPGPEPQVIHFTSVHPGFYGISFHSIRPSGGAQGGPAPFHPQPGRYVMGDAPLYGLVGPDPQQLDWFRRARPTTTVGHSLFVYDVTTSPAWVAQCITPTAPLNDAAIASGFGRSDLRRADFDCAMAWLYPGGGNQFGVYGLHHNLLVESRCFSLLRCDPVPINPFIARHLSSARLSYEQRDFSLLPAFALYERSGEPTPRLIMGRAAPASTPPAAVANTDALAAPVALDGPLAFLGASAFPAQDNLEVETWWQVTQSPITRPLSIMAHLLTEQGESLGVADGLGISPLTLATGDIVVQRHRFAKPPEGKMWLRTGAYWLDTTVRWAVTGSRESDALFVPLKTGH